MNINSAQNTTTPIEPFVSLVIVTWNRCSDVKNTLLQYRKQTYKNFETIVVDNFSTDGTQEMIKSEFEYVRFFELDSNTGLKAFNIGMKAAKGEIIIISDDDAYIEHDGIRKIVEKFQNQKDSLAVVATSLVFVPSNIEYKWYPNEIIEPFNEKGYDSHYFINAGVGFRSDVLKKTGYYDEDFFMWMFEVDISTRIIGEGYDVKYFPEIKAFHKDFVQSTGTKKKVERSLYYSFRNIIWYYWKYFPIHIALGRSLIRIPFDFLWITLRCRNPIIAIKALIDIFKGMPNNLKKRKPIPKQFVKKALANQSEISNLLTFIKNKIRYKLGN
jgi:GT2 family glycosyltransferase